MRKTVKNSLLIITAVLSALCLFFGAHFIGNKTVYAESVDVNTVSVDVIGNLEWDAVDGADGYKWSYTVGGQKSNIYFVEDNKVNVGVALTKAAQKAVDTKANEASVKFTVTPLIDGQDGTATEYTHTFTKYIDYGYKTHDITDIDATYRDGTKTYASKNQVTSAAYKNDVLTMGMTFTGALGETQIWLFGNHNAGTGHRGRYNHSITLTSWGTVQFFYYSGSTTDGGTKGGAVAHSTDKFGNPSDAYNKGLETNKKYYLSMAVFDTYDLTGALVGETIYFDRSVKDSGKLVSVGGGSYFYDKATLDTAGVVYEDTHTNLSGMDNVKFDKSTIRFRTYAAAESVSVTSGVLESAPTFPYYDNVDASFNWNRVAGATEYQWAHGDNDYQAVKGESVSVKALLEEYADLGYLPLRVRAIVDGNAGATTYFNLDLEEFYSQRSIAVDISETGARFSEPETYYQAASVLDKNAGIEKGDHVSFAFKVNEDFADAATSNTTMLFKFGLFGKESDIYHNMFNLIVNYDGEIQLSRCGTAADSNIRYAPLYWRNVFVEDGFEVGAKYFVTYGVDDVYVDGVKTAERITARFYKEEGSYRKTIANISYDYRQFDDENVVAMEYDDHIVYQMSRDNDIFKVGLMPASFDVEYQVYFVAEDEVTSIKTVQYGQKYDFRLELLTEIDGYVVNGYSAVVNGLEKNFDASGFWNIHSDNGKIMVEASLTAIEYGVTYEYNDGGRLDGVTNSAYNKSTYYKTSDWDLQSPEKIPDGYVFEGWYEKSDVDYSDKITTLKGRTGDIILIARYKRGGYMTVITEELELTENIKWTEDQSFTLTEKSVFGKKFVKWQVLTGGNYVDYQGTTTFTPTQSYTFKAIYDVIEYDITFIAEDATHSNTVQKYTIHQKVVFTNAEKEGWFFLGWYKDENFTLPVTDTDGLAEDLTLYAQFMKDTLPQRLSVVKSSMLQALPVPELPEGATYKVELYKGVDKLAVIENTYFIFEQTGEYNLTYAITLPTGQKINKQLVVTVENSCTVTVHYSDGSIQTIVKRQGEKIELSELNNTPDGFILKGIYLDADYKNAFNDKEIITKDINLYVKYDKLNDEKDTNNVVLIAVIGGLGALVAVGVVVSVVLIKKRKH